MKTTKQTFGLNPIELKGGFTMKTISMLMIALLLFSAMPLVAAEDNGTEAPEIVSPGITPDSYLYGLERAMERLRLAFTLNKMKKLEYRIMLAEERLAEAEQMIEKNKKDHAERAQKLHDELVVEVEEEIEELESNGDNVTAEESLEEIEKIHLKLLGHGEKVEFVHKRILERLSQNENVTEEKITHLESVFEKIIAKAYAIEQKINLKREQVRTVYKVLSAKNESALTEREAEFLARIEAKQQAREEFKQKKEEFRTNLKAQLARLGRNRNNSGPRATPEVTAAE